MVSCKRHVPHSAVSAPGGNAVGDLYLDDGHTYDHKNKGAFARRRFEWSGNTLTSKEAPAPYGNPKADALELAPSVTVERILIWGWHGKPTKVTITEAGGDLKALMQHAVAGGGAAGARRFRRGRRRRGRGGSEGGHAPATGAPT